MKANTVLAKIRDSVQVSLVVNNEIVKQYLSVEIPDSIKDLDMESCNFDFNDKITFQLHFQPGILPNEFPGARVRPTRAELTEQKLKNEAAAAIAKAEAQAARTQAQAAKAAIEAMEAAAKADAALAKAQAAAEAAKAKAEAAEAAANVANIDTVSAAEATPKNTEAKPKRGRRKAEQTEQAIA